MDDNNFPDGYIQAQFIALWNQFQHVQHAAMVARGFWEGERNDGECIALMHSELSETLEGLRHGNPPSDHIPAFSAVEEELADVIIRIMDFAGARGYRVAEAILEKMIFNASRPYKHGKRF